MLKVGADNSINLVAVITGSSRGLGRNLAQYFLNKGYIILGCSRGESTIDHKNYHHFKIDVGNEDDVRSWVRKIKKLFGKIDLLICNAGLVRSALFLSLIPSSEMELMIRTNYFGVFYMLREISKVMALRGYGRIITISSTMVLLHEEGTSVYSATKAAITETTKVLAKELASKGITCNVIAPAMMCTESSTALSRGSDWQKRMLDKQIFPRFIEPDEICHIAEFFASPKSKAITGQVIYVGMIG
jgi:3-oxoacyl-[acyl-carrier protein] reductase